MRIVSRLAAVVLAAVVGLAPSFASAQQKPWYPPGGAAGPAPHGPGGPAFHGPRPGGPAPGVSPRWNGGDRRDFGMRHDRQVQRDYRGYRGYRGHYRSGWDPGAAAAAGIIGLAVGSMVAGSASGSRHVDRCLNRYRSYDPSSDTYLGYDGRRHRCRL